MKPGPKPLSNDEKWLRGYIPERPPSNGNGAKNQGGRPIKVPPAPGYFGKHGRRAWRSLYKELYEADLLTTQDLLSFEILCGAYEQVRLSSEALAEHGPLIEGTRGTFVRNPAGVQLRESTATFIKMADRFGLHPRAAESLGLVSDET